MQFFVKGFVDMSVHIVFLISWIADITERFQHIATQQWLKNRSAGKRFSTAGAVVAARFSGFVPLCSYSGFS